MIKGYWITIENAEGCKLNGVFVKDEKDIPKAIDSIAGYARGGDTIKIREGESEE